MFPLAVNFGLSLLLGTGQLAASQRLAWSHVRPDILTVRYHGHVSGVAVLIDSKGYFLAHRSAIPSAELSGTTFDGKSYHLTRIGLDDPSGLVLVMASGWKRPIPPVRVAKMPKSGDSLIAVLTSGPISSEFVSGDRFGVVAPSQRLMPLIEVSFESRSEKVAGALIFDEQGDLLGALNATLEARSDDGSTPDLNVPATSLRPATQVSANAFGPSQMTVAYSVGPDAILQVWHGFRTESHIVWRPFLGITCKDAPEGGAYVDGVFPNSPAERAGLRMGDVIFHVGGYPVKNQVDFAKAMLKQRVGSQMEVGYIRDDITSKAIVALDKSKD